MLGLRTRRAPGHAAPAVLAAPAAEMRSWCKTADSSSWSSQATRRRRSARLGLSSRACPMAECSGALPSLCACAPRYERASQPVLNAYIWRATRLLCLRTYCVCRTQHCTLRKGTNAYSKLSANTRQLQIAETSLGQTSIPAFRVSMNGCPDHAYFQNTASAG